MYAIRSYYAALLLSDQFWFGVTVDNLVKSDIGVTDIETYNPVITSYSIHYTKLYEISISNVAKGETVVTWTLAKSSCSNEAKVIIRNNSLIVNAGLDKTICNGNLLLNGTVPPVGTSGSWSVVSGLASIADASKYNAEASGFNRGANTLRWTVTKNGCASSDDVVITNRNNFVQHTLYEVIRVDGQVVTYSGLNSGFYTIKVTDLLASEQKVCTSKSEVVNLQLITISGTTVPNTCGSTSLNVGAIRDVKIEGASNSVTWAWDEISGDKVTDNTQLSQENLPAGTYLLNVVDVARGCTPSPLTKTFVVGRNNFVQHTLYEVIRPSHTCSTFIYLIGHG